MRKTRPAFAIVLLVVVQLFCVLPGQGQPTVAPGITSSPPEVTVTSTGDSVGTINLVNSQVQTGPPDNLQFLEGQQDFHNGDGVRVTAGGKGKLTLDDGSFLTLFNETEVSGVNVITSPPETDLFLQNEGFLGHVPPGENFKVNMPNGAQVEIFGTYFFALYNDETQVAAAGNFDGLVSYTPPGGTEQELPRSTMVNIPAEGEVVLMELPFTHEQFESSVDSAGTPTAGLSTLVQEYQIEPQPIPSKPPAANTPQEVARVIHDAPVYSAAFSPDGRYVVSGSEDGTIIVSETSNGQEVARMLHDDAVYAVVFHTHGNYVVSASADNTAKVWDVSTRDEIARMTHEHFVRHVAISPDGNYVASGGLDDTARVWEVGTGFEVASMAHDGDVESLAFSPDGRYVVTGSFDFTARIWEVATGSEVASMLHEGEVTSVAFSPDGRYVVSGSLDNTVRVWDAATGNEIARMTHDDAVDSVAFSPDGRYVLSGSGDNTVREWDASTGLETARMTHDDAVLSIAFSPDGRYVASGSVDRTARVWDASTGMEIARMDLPASVPSIAFSPDGQYIVAGSDGIASVWTWQPTCQIGC